MLLVGTGDGVYRTGTGAAADAERVLDCGRVTELRAAADGVYAATRSGLFHTPDAGGTWSALGVPTAEVWCVDVAADRVLAGGYPVALFVAGRAVGPPVGEAAWTRLSALEAAEGNEAWYCPGDPDRGRLRAVRAVAGRPDRLLAGVEVGGLYASDDRGGAWTDNTEAVAADVHDVNVRGPDEYLVACGRLDRRGAYGPAGCFRTTDAGASWTRLDLGGRGYVRETLVHDGVLYVAGATGSPGSWDGPRGADAALFESTDDGATVERRPYPGEPAELVFAWAVHDGTVYGGTGTRTHPEGRLLRRGPEGWTDAGTLPAAVHSLVAV